MSKTLRCILMTVWIMICTLVPMAPSHAFGVSRIMTDTKGAVSINVARHILHAVYEQSIAYNVDPTDIFRIMRIESRWNPQARSFERLKGKSKAVPLAKGLMQVIPRYHEAKIAGRDIYDIDVNIEVGVRVFREYLDKANGNRTRALQLYNGSGRSMTYVKLFNAVSTDDGGTASNNIIRDISDVAVPAEITLCG